MGARVASPLSSLRKRFAFVAAMTRILPGRKRKTRGAPRVFISPEKKAALLRRLLVHGADADADPRIALIERSIAPTAGDLGSGGFRVIFAAPSPGSAP